MIRLAALLSGGGRTLINLLDEIERGTLDAEVACVIASRASATGIARAEARGLDVFVASREAYPDDRARDDAIAAHLATHAPTMVVLCGYLRYFRVDPPYVGRTLNIHPSLLPKFGGRGMYGDRVHAAVLAAGESESGCTVHLVDEEYDHGPVVLQRRCPVESDDTVETLAARVFHEECLAYPEAIRHIAATIAAPAE